MAHRGKTGNRGGSCRRTCDSSLPVSVGAKRVPPAHSTAKRTYKYVRLAHCSREKREMKKMSQRKKAARPLWALVIFAAAICGGARFEASQWMEPETKVEALEREQTEESVQTPEPAGELAAGTILTKEQAEADLDELFQIYEISDELFARIYGKSYKEDCTVPREELRYLKVLHYNFDHQIQVGELMVNREIAPDCLEIFQELYTQEYEIYSMYLVDDFDADDTLSCERNNTSAFNFRTITGGESLSNHAYGYAIDINPQQNPYLLNGVYYHENSAPYIDRTGTGEHMINHEDLCYQLFTQHGFIWGGDWQNPIDYQHFEYVTEG